MLADRVYAISFKNASDDKMTFCLEPWAHEFDVLPGSTIYFAGDGGDTTNQQYEINGVRVK